MSESETLLPRGWASAPLGELGAWLGGGTPSKGNADYWIGSIPWVSPKDMKSFDIYDAEDHISARAVAQSTTRVLPAESVLVVTRSGILRHSLPVAVARREVAINQDLKALIPAKGISARYLAYAIRAGEQQILHECSKDGTTVQSVDLDRLREHVVYVAPMREQIRIADELDNALSELDAAINSLVSIRSRLSVYRISVLKSAVDGTLTADWRAEHAANESGTDLLRRILLERRERWERQQLAGFAAKGQTPPANWRERYVDPIAPESNRAPGRPSTWCRTSWAQVGYSQNGRLFPSTDYQSHGVKLLRPGNMYPNGTVGWDERSTRYLPVEYADSAAKLLIGAGELVINLTAQSLKDDFLGRVCTTSDGERCLLNQRLARLTPIFVNPRFLLAVFKAPQFRRFVASLNTGSLIQHMFTSQLAVFEFDLPPLAEQQAIVDIVDEQLSIAERLEDEIDRKSVQLGALRQSILRHAFTGQLVPQDPNDEPASVLLERIAAQRAAAGPAVRAKRPRRKRAAPKK